MMDASGVGVGLLVLVFSAAAAFALFIVLRRWPPSGSPAPPKTTDKVLHPISWRSLRIESVTRVSPAVRLIRVALPKPTDTLDLPIGRHISVRVVLPSGQAVARPYTPVSPPWATGYFDLLVKHYDGGVVSSHVAGLVPGDSLSLRGPVGNLRWVPSEHPRILLLAAGTGITPMLQLMRCILEARCDGGDATAADLLFQNRTDTDVLLRGDIDACVARRPESFTAQACISPRSLVPRVLFFCDAFTFIPRAVLFVPPAPKLGHAGLAHQPPWVLCSYAGRGVHLCGSRHRCAHPWPGEGVQGVCVWPGVFLQRHGRSRCHCWCRRGIYQGPLRSPAVLANVMVPGRQYMQVQCSVD